MAIEKDYSSQGRKIIEEYLEASGNLLTERKSDGGVYGYTALLIMLCIIDAIGQSTESIHGTNFSILTEEQFNLGDAVVKQITHWYRNGLSHVGAMPENIFIDLGEEHEDPFEITGSKIKSVKLKSLHKKIASSWEARKETFVPGRIEDKKSIGFPREYMSSRTAPSSGCSTESVTVSGSVNIKKV